MIEIEAQLPSGKLIQNLPIGQLGLRRNPF